MAFIDKVLEILEKRNMSAYKLCKETGISQQTFANWKTGKQPPIDKATKIISYLGVSADEILELKIHSTLNLKEKELIELFKQLPEPEQMRELGRLEEKVEQIHNAAELSKPELERLSTSRTG